MIISIDFLFSIISLPSSTIYPRSSNCKHRSSNKERTNENPRTHFSRTSLFAGIGSAICSSSSVVLPMCASKPASFFAAKVKRPINFISLHEQKNQNADPMLPSPFRVQRVRQDTYDTFTLELQSANGMDGLRFSAGQFNMLYVFGIGEVPISISGDPAMPATLVHTTRAVGTVTKAMRKLKRGRWRAQKLFGILRGSNRFIRCGWQSGLECFRCHFHARDGWQFCESDRVV